jgi:hypothetical protein
MQLEKSLRGRNGLPVGGKNKLAYFCAPTGIHIGPMSIHRAAALCAVTSGDSTPLVNNPKNPVHPVK